MVTWRRVLLFSVFIREIMCYDNFLFDFTETTTLPTSFEQFMNQLDKTVYRQKNSQRRLNFQLSTSRPVFATTVKVNKKELQLVKPLIADVLMMKLVKYYEGKLQVPAETSTSLLAFITATATAEPVSFVPDYADVNLFDNADDYNHREETVVSL